MNDSMIFGTRAIMEAIHAGKEMDRILLQRDLKNPLILELKTLLKESGLAYQAVPAEKLNRITRKNHQGVIAFLSPVSFYRIDQLVPSLFTSGRFPVLLMLDRVTDVRNFGAICRSAECFGIDAVIIPERGTAAITGDAVKASAGALSRIKICRESNLKESIAYLKDSGYTVVGCTEKAKQALFDYHFEGPICLIMGSESDGISGEYLKRCDRLLTIPMAGHTASLNVSVAAGIMMYELVRQLNRHDKQVDGGA